MKLMDFKVQTEKETEAEGHFVISPLPTGYGYTLGNSLRRVLLSSLKGAAITEVRVKGVPHQFTSIPGMKEDIVHFLLNLKRVRFKLYQDEPVALKLETSGLGKVKASDIKPNPQVEVVNKDQLLATLTTKSAKLDADLLVEPGYGYEAEEALESSKIGVLPLDSSFSPVREVAYTVEETRVGEMTNLDQLRIKIKTDETIKPSAALKEASKILVSFFKRLSGEELPVEGEKGKHEGEEGVKLSEKEKEIAVDDLELPLRTINALKRGKIKTLGDLATKKRADFLKVRGLGETSVKQIEQLIESESWK